VTATRSRPPTQTDQGLRSSTQCAAVSTASRAISVPVHSLETNTTAASELASPSG